MYITWSCASRGLFEAFNQLQQERHQLQEELLEAQKVSQQLAQDGGRGWFGRSCDSRWHHWIEFGSFLCRDICDIEFIEWHQQLDPCWGDSLTGSCYSVHTLLKIELVPLGGSQLDFSRRRKNGGRSCSACDMEVERQRGGKGERNRGERGWKGMEREGRGKVKGFQKRFACLLQPEMTREDCDQLAGGPR